MNNKSFTLIELLVVIVIIGILAGVIMISTSSSIDKANFAKAQAFSKTVQNELLLDLVSEWTFDEPEVLGKTSDSWGNNHGIVNGAATYNFNNCVFGSCYDFDGLNDSIYANNDPSICFGTTDVSISFFFKFDQNCPESMIIDKGGGIGRFWISTNATTGVIRINSYFGTGKDYWLDGTKKVNDNNWHHIFAVFDRDDYEKIYIDGVFDRELNMSGALLDNWDSTSTFRISSGIYHYFKGSIDDVRIYNAALSLSEIKQNYIAGLDSLLSQQSISKEDYNQRISELAYE